jgi:hypothetical protein
MAHRLRFVAVVVCLCSAAAAAAQSLGEVAKKTEEKRKSSPKATTVYTTRDVDVTASAQEIINYEITPERWRLFKAADAAMMRAIERDAALLDRIMALKIETASSLERFLMREPALAAALASVGTNARDHAATQIAISAALIITRNPQYSELSEQMTPAMRANVAFVTANRAELQAMEMQFAAMRARLGR